MTACLVEELTPSRSFSVSGMSRWHSPHCDPVRGSYSGARTRSARVGGAYSGIGAGVAATPSAWVVSLSSKIRGARYRAISCVPLVGGLPRGPASSGSIGYRTCRARLLLLAWALLGPIVWL